MAPSIWQILLIVLVVLLIFGAGKLPQVMGDLAKGVKNFKRGLEEDDSKKGDGSKTSPKAVSDHSADKSAEGADKAPADETSKDKA